MAVLFGFHNAFSGHDTGLGHPESNRRLLAVKEGIDRADIHEGVIEFAPRRVTHGELELVHPRHHIDELELLCASGGGAIDPDTVVAKGSFEAALRAAGAGLEAIDRLRNGEADNAFLAVRPPGHHARRSQAMGFCLFNSAAIACASLIGQGERVLILDWDAHHGNGTQEIFYDAEDVLFISFHQYPFYPGTGAIEEVGKGPGRGRTINIPVPRGTTGDAYRYGFDELVIPAAEAFSPTWLIVSAGFDAHRADPLTDLGLRAQDFADFTRIACHLAPPARRLFFLEGGYDFEALAESVAGSVSAMLDVNYSANESERAPAGGGAGPDGQAVSVIMRARELHDQAKDHN